MGEKRHSYPLRVGLRRSALIASRGAEYKSVKATVIEATAVVVYPFSCFPHEWKVVVMIYKHKLNESHRPAHAGRCLRAPS